MQIALFGGAFDPPQLGHQQVTTAILKKKIVDEVWYVPVRQHPFSKQLQASDQQRLEMLQLITTAGTRIEIYELSSPEVSYAYYTLEALAKKYSTHQFSWIIGSDNVAAFHKWKFYEQLLAKYPVYVYPRAGFVMEPLYDGMVPLSMMPEVAVSSSQVRDAIKAGQSIDNLVDPQIAAYIAQHQLYR